MPDARLPVPDAAVPPDWELLARYLAGESAPNEVQRVEAWLAANPSDRELLTQVARYASEVQAELPLGLDVEGALRKVKDRVEGQQVIPIDRAPARRGFTFRVWHAAAAVALGALGWAALRTQATTDTSAPQLAVEHNTGAGAVDSLTLADGSQVVLAPGSRLTVPAGFGGSAREVELVGAAWFRAAHDDARPFVVKSGSAYVRDVGTEFTVMSRERDSVLVQVHEGSVRVRGWDQPADEEVLLDIGDEVLVQAGAVGQARRDVVPADASAWVSGSIVFKDTPLEVVASVVRRQYGFDLRIGDMELGRRRVNITVNVRDLSSVPQELALAVGGEVQQRGQTAIVRPTTP